MELLNIEDINLLTPKTAVTVGMFDGLHVGHRHLVARLLEVAGSEKLKPVVVTFDRHPRQVLDPATPMALLSTFDERLALLEECGVQTVVMVHFDAEKATLSACDFARRFLCNRLNMRILLLGYDNMFGSRRNNDFDQLPTLADELGFSICRDEAVQVGGVEVSSTKIRKALQRGDLAVANAMLGAPYKVSGTVVHGRHVGTALGFPTANLLPADSAKMLPAAGVYALRASVGGRSYAAMANLGTQPTFHQDQPVLEVHLLDFEGNIYGRQLSVEFIDRIRDIRTFESPEALALQLKDDRAVAYNLINKQL